MRFVSVIQASGINGGSVLLGLRSRCALQARLVRCLPVAAALPVTGQCLLPLQLVRQAEVTANELVLAAVSKRRPRLRPKNSSASKSGFPFNYWLRMRKPLGWATSRRPQATRNQRAKA